MEGGEGRGKRFLGPRSLAATALLAVALVTCWRAGLAPRAVWLDLSPTRPDRHWDRVFRSERPPNLRVRSAEDLPTILPGPADSWAGGREWTLALEPSAAVVGDAVVELRLFDAHEAVPPVIEVAAGGQAVGRIAVRPGRGGPPPHSRTGLRSRHSVRVPGERPSDASALTLTTKAGSWVAIERVTVASAATIFDPHAALQRLLVSPGKLGWGGLFFGALALAFGIAPGRRRLSERERLLCCFLAVLVAALLLNHRIGRARPSTTGDEPNYLLMAHSLVVDGDFDVHDELLAREYAAFYPGGLRTFRSTGYYWHEPGLALLIAPFYAAGGLPAVWIFLDLVFAATVTGVVAWLRRDRTPWPRALAVAGAVGFAAPFVFYSCQLYPDPVAAGCLFAGFALVRGAEADRARNAVLLAVILALLPWIQSRFALPGAILGLVALARSGAAGRAILVGIAALSAAAFAAFNLHHFGGVLPVGREGQFSASVFFRRGLPGLFLDAHGGLVFLVPVLALAPAGLVLLGRSDRRSALLVAAITLSLVLPAAAFEHWHGGTVPAGRYLVPFLPLLALPLDAIVRTARGAARAGVVLAALGGVALGLFLMRVPHHQFAWAAWMKDLGHLLGGIPLVAAFPNLVAPGAGTYRSALVWLAVVVVANFALVRAADQRSR